MVANGKTTDLAQLRARCRRTGVAGSDLAGDPLEQFARWHREWCEIGPYDPAAAVLATADRSGRPSARWIDVARVDHGFVFVTGHMSRKGTDLATNRRAALCFGWLELERQVRVEGLADRLTDVESDELFGALPRPAQALAWATDQRRVIPDRSVLERKTQEIEARFAGQEVPRTRHWGGYRLLPDELEFWQGRVDGLHDRFRYRRSDGDLWRIECLAP